MATKEIVAHTPGPWFAFDDEIVAEPGDVHIATVDLVASTGATEWQANMRLIAKAPELLSMLKAQRCDFCGYHLGVVREPRSGPACETCAPARAVIASAEAGQS